MIEKFIEGKELTCMALNGEAYVVTELVAGNDFYDYQAKYTNGVTKHILPAHRKFFLYFRLSGIYVILIWAILSNLERKSIHVFQPDEKYQSAAQKAQCH